MATDRPENNTHPVTALQRLIADQMKARRLSLADVANASIDGSGKRRIHRNRVSQLKNHPIRQNPSRRVVEGLAVGLGLPLSTVKDAITESLNLRVVRDASDPELDVLIDDVQELDPVRRQRYLRMARALLEEFKQ